MPITNPTSSLRLWKSYVLKFRQDFEQKYGACNADAALSLLLAGLSIKILERSLSAGSSSLGKGISGDPGRAAAEVHLLASEAIGTDRYVLSHSLLSFEEELCDLLMNIESAELRDCLENPLIVGYTYQYFCDSDRKVAQREIQTANKHINRDGLIAFTQIYTPAWVVDFILANTLPASIVSQSAGDALSLWRLPVCEDGEPGEFDRFTVLDPACGAGNFLVRAFDMLMELHVRAGCLPAFAARHILENQLYGADIDPIALSVVALNLCVRSLQHGVDSVPPMPGLLLANPDDEPMLGSLSEAFTGDHPLSRKYDAVVTNPPYIGRKLISRHMKELLKERFPLAHHDLSSAFFQRCLDLLKPGGRCGLITQASVMFLPSYEKLRRLIIDRYELECAVDLGPGVFPLQGGEKVSSAILVVGHPVNGITTKGSHDGLSAAARGKGIAGSVHGDPRAKAIFIDLTRTKEKGAELENSVSQLREDKMELAVAKTSNVLKVVPSVFLKFKGCSFNYFVPPPIADLLRKSQALSAHAEIKQGLATTDNDRFVKLIWEVPEKDLHRIWFPYAKGAGEERWYSPIKHVVNWENGGEAIKRSVTERYPYLNGKFEWVVKNESFYFKKGLCFSFVNTKGNAVRIMPPGCIFDVGASAIFSPFDDFLLGYLNSSFMVALARSLNPTINYQVGDLKNLPMLIDAPAKQAAIAEKAAACIRVKQDLTFLCDATSWFDPTCGASVRERMLLWQAKYTELSRMPVQRACEHLNEARVRLEAELDAHESEIDSLVMDAVATRNGWSASKIAEVNDWIKQWGGRSRTSAGEVQERFVDNYLILVSLKPSSRFQGINQTQFADELKAHAGPQFPARLRRYFGGSVHPHYDFIQTI